MKAVGCVVAVFAVAVVGFFGVVAFVITRGEDQSALTERIQVTVTNPRETYYPKTGTHYEFDYAYQVDGQWYGGVHDIRDNYWQPGQFLWACFNPDRPRDHVLTFRSGELCGHEFIVGGSIDKATPTPAPVATP